METCFKMRLGHDASSDFYDYNQNQTYTNAARGENQLYKVILVMSILLTVVAAEIPQLLSCVLAQDFQAQVEGRFPLGIIYTIALVMNVSSFYMPLEIGRGSIFQREGCGGGNGGSQTRILASPFFQRPEHRSECGKDY